MSFRREEPSPAVATQQQPACHSSLLRLLGFGGAMLVTDTQFGIPAAFFYASALDQIELMDYLMGLLKTPVFGALIALIACHNGMRTVGGTAGVGRGITRAVVTSVIAIMIADHF